MVRDDKKIRIITTGGTIDKVYFDANSHYQVGESEVHSILEESHVTVDYEFVELLRKDSLELTDSDRRLIRLTIEEAPESRIVVTHGTDTMVHTAQALRDIPGKVVVLTGSLYPARFKGSDAVYNVAAAVTAVQCLPEGIYIVMNGRVFDPDRVRKNRSLRRFEEIDPPSAPTPPPA